MHDVVDSATRIPRTSISIGAASGSANSAATAYDSGAARARSTGRSGLGGHAHLDRADGDDGVAIPHVEQPPGPSAECRHLHGIADAQRPGHRSGGAAGAADLGTRLAVESTGQRLALLGGQLLDPLAGAADRAPSMPAASAAVACTQLAHGLLDLRPRVQQIAARFLTRPPLDLALAVAHRALARFRALESIRTHVSRCLSAASRSRSASSDVPPLQIRQQRLERRAPPEAAGFRPRRHRVGQRAAAGQYSVRMSDPAHP